ncbi:MAG: helix-turn-helix domain-containing protein [bacterium]
MEKLGKLIQDLRKEKGYNVETFAKEIDLKHISVNLIENGQRLPSAEKLEKIIEVLKLNSDTTKELFKALIFEKLNGTIQDSILKEILFAKNAMPAKFIEKVKKDAEENRYKLSVRLKDVLEGEGKLIKKDIVNLAEELNQPAMEYLSLAEIVPDELTELIQYEGANKLVKALLNLKNPDKIERLISGFTDIIKILNS